jgi:hypothetical protein
MCLDRASERHLIAGMRNRGRDRRQLLRRIYQAQIFVVRARTHMRKMGILIVHASTIFQLGSAALT